MLVCHQKYYKRDPTNFQKKMITWPTRIEIDKRAPDNFVFKEWVVLELLKSEDKYSIEIVSDIIKVLTDVNIYEQ